MTDSGRVADGEQALVNQAPAGLGRSGFDPSRVYVSQGYAMAVFDDGRDADGAPLREVWGFCGEDDYSAGDGWLELRIHEIVETEKSGTLAVYYRQWFGPDGEPAFNMGKPRRRVGSLGSVKALIRRRKMMPRDSDGNPEGGNEVPSRSDDSAGPKVIAQGGAA